jgi:DNA-directed RNA polymerase specialized sigma24 family protein
MTVHVDVPPDNSSLVAQMRPALMKYFKRKSGNVVEAEDLTQDVLVRALTHANWKTPSEAKGYIFRTAINRWRDRHRRQKTHGVTVTLDEAELEELGTQSPPECVLIVREDHALALDSSMHHTPPSRGKNVGMYMQDVQQIVAIAHSLQLVVPSPLLAVRCSHGQIHAS